MLVAYLTVFLVSSTTGTLAPLIQALFCLLFSFSLMGFLCCCCFLILHLIAQKITNTKKLAKVFVNEISLPPPLFCFHTHTCHGLHLYKLFISLPLPKHITVMIGQLKLKHPWRKMFYSYKGTNSPPHTTPLPPHTFPHNLLEEYRICTSVRISLPSSPEHSCHLICFSVIVYTRASSPAPPTSFPIRTS